MASLQQELALTAPLALIAIRCEYVADYDHHLVRILLSEDMAPTMATVDD